MIILKDFIKQIISIAIVGIIIELIIPKGNTKKYVYIILSLFMLLNIVSPIINVIKDNNMQSVLNNIIQTISGDVKDIDDGDIAAFSEYKDMKISENLEENMKKEIKEKLIDLGITVKNVKIGLEDDYSFKELRITIENLDNIKDKKIDKISDIIELLSKEYNIDNNVIKIIEEGK